MVELGAKVKLPESLVAIRDHCPAASVGGKEGLGRYLAA